MYQYSWSAHFWVLSLSYGRTHKNRRPLYTCNEHGYKAGEGVLSNDKLMSGSSLEVKPFLRNHKSLNSKAFYFGRCKTWTLDSGLDNELDCGLIFGLSFGLNFPCASWQQDHMALFKHVPQVRSRYILRCADGSVPAPPFDLCVAHAECCSFHDATGILRTPQKEQPAHYHFNISCIRVVATAWLCSLQHCYSTWCVAIVGPSSRKILMSCL